MTAPAFPAFPPLWAEVFGEDDHGIFAECSVQSVRFVWRWIPPGRFLMGSPPEEIGRWDDEGPQHPVTISCGFWLGETPVTQAQWVAVMEKNPSGFKGDEAGQRPVETVSWHDSVAFAQRLNEALPGLHGALPTEAQWEYACRAGTESAFHNGKPCTQPEGDDPALNELGWFNKNSEGQTHVVKEKLPNAWGLYDMHGNVWEWCHHGLRTYTAEAQRDPGGTQEEGARRVLRGGSWYRRARSCRAACRSRGDPGVRSQFLGLRLAAGQEPEAAEPLGAERPLGKGLRDEAGGR